MPAGPYRIFLRGSPLPFLITVSVLFMASMFLWALMITPDQSRFGLFTPTVVLFLLAYFVHRGSLSWIRISRDSREIVRVPSWFARKLIGEKQLVVQVPSGSELIFCRRLAYGGILGYYIIVRAPNGAEQIVWNDLTGVTRGRWSRVAKEIGSDASCLLASSLRTFPTLERKRQSGRRKLTATNGK